MSMKRFTIILVQLTVIMCLLMVAYTFLLYSSTADQTPVASLLSAGGVHVGGGGGGVGGGIDGGFVLGVSRPIQRPRILNHNQMADGTGLLEMADGGGGGGGDGTGSNIVLERYNEHDVKSRQLREKIERLTAHSYIGHQADEAERHAAEGGAQFRPYENVSTPQVHIFYRAPVPWYDADDDDATAAADNNDVDADLSRARYIREPDGIADSANRITVQPLRSIFYPLLGVYSITTKVLDVHFRNIMQAGVGVLVFGWQPHVAGSLELLKHVMNYAHKTCAGRLAVAVELLPYAGRTVGSVRGDVERLHAAFVWSHPVMYRVHVQSRGGGAVPLVYVRDACTMAAAEEWAQMLAPGGMQTVRGTSLDGVFVGEIGTKKDTSTIRRGHLDGFYTRAASNGATYASTWKNWDLLQQTADRYRLLFIPTVAPGFCVRQHEREQAALRRHRSNGQYYGVAWRTAMSVGAHFVSIASYNDWPAGTQVEEAMPYAGHRDYQPTGPRKYLDLTKHWVEEFVRVRRTEAAAKGAGCEAFFNNTIC